MNTAVMLHFARTFSTVAFRRARTAPRRPEWSVLYETIVEGLNATRRRTEGLPIPDQRAIWHHVAMPNGVASRVTFTRVEGAPVPLTWVAPRVRPIGGPAMLFLHGGAFGFGSMKTHGEMVSRIALASGARVLFVDYRLAPEHPFPAAIDDALRAYEWMVEREDPRRLVVAGDSAGGNLTGMVLIRARDAGLPLPAGGVMICPWVDLGWDETHDPDPDDWITGPWGDAFRAAYLAGTPADDPRVSPLRNDLRGLPPLLVQAGGAEILGSQIAAFVERAGREGVRVTSDITPGMVHDWHMFAGIYSPAQEAIDAVGRFVRSVANARPVPAPLAEPARSPG